MQIPESLIRSLLNTKGFDQKSFERVHYSGDKVTSIRLNQQKRTAISRIPNFKVEEMIPWAENGFYLSERPSFTFDPLFHAGCYYVQEASSMFLEQALKQTTDLSKPLKVLDLCAAPGGKSTHLQSLISKDSLLVSNEVIRSRANILKENIIKWGCGNVVVTNNDPSHFLKLENYFDIIVVDAPCSGSGLFRRDPDAIKEWSESNVQLCSQRQQRILADVWPALKQNGILIYSTCSYSNAEDEDICEWIQNNFLVDRCFLHCQEEWGVIESGGGYRFWPDKVKGEGFFLACFKKMNGGVKANTKIKNKPEDVTKADLGLISEWVTKKDKYFIKHEQTVYAWPNALLKDFYYLVDKLKVIYSGIICGELMKNKLVPSHALAMSDLVLESIGVIELSNDEAIKFLQRKEIQIVIKGTGWKIVAFQQHPLGWINILPNRINNYYPKELRILKEHS